MLGHLKCTVVSIINLTGLKDVKQNNSKLCAKMSPGCFDVVLRTYVVNIWYKDMSDHLQMVLLK